MRVHLHPQRRTVEVSGRRSVGRLLNELGVLPSTAMVIRRDELLTDGEMIEDDDEIEIRAVISGGSGTKSRARAREPMRSSPALTDAASQSGSATRLSP
jgi:sulfur carrier protein